MAIENETSVREERLVLAGRRVDAAADGTRKIVAPADGSVLAEVAEASAEDVRRAVEAAAAAQPEWAARSPRERGDVLNRIAELLDSRAEEMARLEALNTGRPILETRGEVAGAARFLRFYAGVVEAAGGSTLPVDANGLLLTVREPIGICALITAWNAPLGLGMMKLAPALVSGNAAILKPSELTPLTTLRLADMATEAGLPEGCLSVITGDGKEVGTPLVEHPAIGRVSFTGSTAVGRRVAAAAAAGFKRLTLELGGKSACVVFPDVDLENVARIVPRAAFAMTGQDCCSRSRLIVHEDVAEEFVGHYVDAVEAMRVGDPLDEETEIGPLISFGHRDRVHGFVDRACADGARVLTGGELPAGEDPAEGSYYPPTVLGGVGPQMEIARSEVFGPVVSVLTFSTEEEAIALANDSDFGLSGSIWTGDGACGLRVARAVHAGVLAVNSNTSVYLQAPFGGVGQSGVGRESGLAGLDACTETKTIFLAAD